MAVYDAIVVGGGVVGAAIARELQSSGLQVVLCEKEKEWLTGASSGNTGHLGSNFYYTRSRAPLEAEMTAKAREINPSWLAGQYNVPARKDGLIYLARGEEEEKALDELLSLAEENRIKTVRRISIPELKELEPGLDCEGVSSAILSEEEYIVDPWLLSMTHIYGCEVSGVDMKLDCEVQGAEKIGDVWVIQTNQGTIKGKLVFNCGGNYGDLVEKLGNLQSVPNFTIKPGKGEYLILSGDNLEQRVRRPILPVPTKQTAGVYIFKSISGHTVVGPTNIRQESRTDRSVSQDSIKSMMDHVQSLYPGTKVASLLGTYAGLRPATEHQDYMVSLDLTRGWITLGGIRSTGLTCSLALSQYICSQVVPGYSPSLVPLLPSPVLTGDRVRFGDKDYLPTHPLSSLNLFGYM